MSVVAGIAQRQSASPYLEAGGSNPPPRFRHISAGARDERTRYCGDG